MVVRVSSSEVRPLINIGTFIFTIFEIKFLNRKFKILFVFLRLGLGLELDARATLSS